MTPCRGSRAQPLNPTEPSLPPGRGPPLRSEWFCPSGCIRNHLSFGPKTKKNADLFPGSLNYTADSSPARPVLAGFRAAFGPAGLWLPLMRIMIRRLNDNSSLILCCLQDLCWPTRSLGSSPGAPHQPRHCSPCSAGGRGPLPVLLKSGPCSQGGIKHQLTQGE